jgi:hypothetical protein
MLIYSDYRYKNRAKLIKANVLPNEISLTREFDYFDCKDVSPFETTISDDFGRRKKITRGVIETVSGLNFNINDYVEIYGERYLIEGVSVTDNDSQKRFVKSPRKTTRLTLRL